MSAFTVSDFVFSERILKPIAEVMWVCKGSWEESSYAIIRGRVGG